jgi:hypothetical protein
MRIQVGRLLWQMNFPFVAEGRGVAVRRRADGGEVRRPQRSERGCALFPARGMREAD